MNDYESWRLRTTGCETAEVKNQQAGRLEAAGYGRQDARRYGCSCEFVSIRG